MDMLNEQDQCDSGLPLSRLLAEAMGGSLTLEGSAGGATFVLRLPTRRPMWPLRQGDF